MPIAADMRAALNDGKAAAESQQRPDSNPFTGGTTARESVLATLWRNGYQAGNPMPAEDPQEEALDGDGD